MSTPNCGFRSVDFSGNDPSGNSSADLVNVFPVTEYHYVQVTGNGNINGTIDLSYNYNSTTNYAVFTNIYYGYNGSGTTSTAEATSETLDSVIINDRNSSGFQYNIQNANDWEVRIYIIFMVIYNNNLDYPNSY